MTHTMYSNVSSTLQKIYEAHWETGNEVNSKAGKLIAFSQRAELERHQTFYGIKYVNGKRRIVRNKTSRSIGEIVNKQGIALKTKLPNLIQWRTYSSSGTTVVGGLFTRGYTEKRENGKVIDRIKVDPVGRGSMSILQKINYGLNDQSNQINSEGNPFSWDNGPSMEKFKGKHVAREFAATGRRNVMGEVSSLLKQGFSDALARREKYINEPMRKAI